MITEADLAYVVEEINESMFSFDVGCVDYKSSNVETYFYGMSRVETALIKTYRET